MTSPATTRRWSLGNESSISTAIDETFPTCTMARRSASSMSARQVANAPSKVHTSGPPISSTGGGGAMPAKHAHFAPCATRIGFARRPAWRPAICIAISAAGFGSVIARAVYAPGRGQPVALGEDGDHLVPARIGGVRPVRSHVPLVRTQRSAGVAVPLRRRRRRVGAQRGEVVERAIVVGKGRRSGLARDPVHLRAGSRIEHLLARQSRRAGAVTERHAADDHLGGLASDCIGLSVARRLQSSTACSPAPVPRTASTRCGARTCV